MCIYNKKKDISARYGATTKRVHCDIFELV